MRFVFFYHAFTSCWNNGHAHFLRGVTRELARLGHQVVVFEEERGWSRQNAVADGGRDILAEAAGLVDGVQIRNVALATLDEALGDADVVLVHEWNEPQLVAAIGKRRKSGGRFELLFHDTHHRAVTAPRELDRFELDGYDGVLLFGQVLRDIYRRRGWAGRAFIWHEAADVTLFRPKPEIKKTHDLVWIGNWGDDERTAELTEFLVEPASRLKVDTAIYGVRYPESARRMLAEHGLDCRGWLPNHRVPDAFAQARATVHIPRGPYVSALPGIPTIRMFEAMACGIPLVSAPWSDTEGLFPHQAYVRVRDGREMEIALRSILSDDAYAAELVANGRKAILAHHTTRHRADELLSIVSMLGAGATEPKPALQTGLSLQKVAS